MVGCATAWELARRDLSVCLLDKGEVSSGTTGLGEGNVLCCDKDPGPELDLARPGLTFFDEIEELLGDEAGIRRKGALVVHADAAGWERERGSGGAADPSRRRMLAARPRRAARGRARAERGRVARRLSLPA